MRLRGVAVVALCAAPFAAQAADAPVAVTPLDAAIANSAHDWSGAFVGVNGGYAWGDSDTSAGSFSADGALGGFQIGYNKQLGSIVIGVEATRRQRASMARTHWPRHRSTGFRPRGAALAMHSIRPFYMAPPVLRSAASKRPKVV